MEVTLVQYATVAGHFPGVAAAAVKARPKKVNKVEVAIEEEPKEETQACAVTPRPKSKGPNRGTPPLSPVKTDPKPTEPKKTGKGSGKGKRANLSKSQKNDDSSVSLSIEEHAKGRLVQLRASG